MNPHKDWCGLGEQKKGGHPINACTCGHDDKDRCKKCEYGWVKTAGGLAVKCECQTKEKEAA